MQQPNMRIGPNHNLKKNHWSTKNKTTISLFTSPSSSKTNRSTPCAAGCCGPKFKLIFLTLFSMGVNLQFHGGKTQFVCSSGYMTGPLNCSINSESGYQRFPSRLELENITSQLHNQVLGVWVSGAVSGRWGRWGFTWCGKMSVLFSVGVYLWGGLAIFSTECSLWRPPYWWKCHSVGVVTWLVGGGCLWLVEKHNVVFVQWLLWSNISWYIPKPTVFFALFHPF